MELRAVPLESPDPLAAVVLCVKAYLREEEDGGYTIRAAHLPGAVSQGETAEEAKAMLAKAVRELVVAYRELGRPVPWTPAAQPEAGETDVELLVDVTG